MNTKKKNAVNMKPMKSKSREKEKKIQYAVISLHTKPTSVYLQTSSCYNREGTYQLTDWEAQKESRTTLCSGKGHPQTLLIVENVHIYVYVAQHAP